MSKPINPAFLNCEIENPSLLCLDFTDYTLYWEKRRKWKLFCQEFKSCADPDQRYYLQFLMEELLEDLRVEGDRLVKERVKIAFENQMCLQ